MKFHKHDHINIGRIESFDKHATETPIASTENIDRSTLGELLPLTSPKKVKEPTPSFFEGILKPAIFDQILNASLLIATGLSTEKSALPIEIHDLHYSSSVITCQNLEPYYYKKPMVKRSLMGSSLISVLLKEKSTTPKSNDMITNDTNTIDSNSTTVNSTATNSTAGNSTIGNCHAGNSTAANSNVGNSTAANSTTGNIITTNSSAVNSTCVNSAGVNSTSPKSTKVDPTKVDSTNVSSNYPDSPLNVWGATGGLLLDHPIICGGMLINKDPNINVISNECHTIESGKKALFE